MRILALDVGSSSIKAAYIKHGKPKAIVQVPVASHYAGPAVEIPALPLLKAVEEALRETMAGHHKLDVIALDTFSPGVVAFDARGKPLAGCITHQDRRSVAEANALEQRVGKERFLQLAGNRPFPGGIGATSLLWLRNHQPALFKKIAMVGQPSTLIIHHLTGTYAIDPSQASFLGLYDTAGLSGWVPELLDAVGLQPHQLPNVRFANETAGTLLPAVAKRLKIPAGVPIIGGLIDTSAAVLGTPMKPGTLVHSAGSTDVLALLLDGPAPAEDILTRPLGVQNPKRWLAVSTVAASGSAVKWAQRVFYPDHTTKAYHQLIDSQAKEVVKELKRPPTQKTGNWTPDTGHSQIPTFAPYLAGDRTSMAQLTASFQNLTLATTREDLSRAIVQALIEADVARFHRLAKLRKIQPTIYTMGGQSELADAMHKLWKGNWNFTPIPGEALGGLINLAEGT